MARLAKKKKILTTSPPGEVASIVLPEELTIPEVQNLAPAIPEIIAPPVVQEMVRVLSQVYIWCPGQKIGIHPGVPTPLLLTGWVRSQLQGKVLTEYKE